MVTNRGVATYLQTVGEAADAARVAAAALAETCLAFEVADSLRIPGLVRQAEAELVRARACLDELAALVEAGPRQAREGGERD